MSNEISIPLTVVKLIVGHMTRTNTEAEKAQLGEWIDRSEETLSAFEQCVNVAFRPIRPDPDASEFGHELFRIAELVIKKIKKQLTTEEQDELNEWSTFSPFNRHLLDETPKTVNMETIYDWLVKRWLEEREKSNLN